MTETIMVGLLFGILLSEVMFKVGDGDGDGDGETQGAYCTPWRIVVFYLGLLILISLWESGRVFGGFLGNGYLGFALATAICLYEKKE